MNELVIGNRGGDEIIERLNNAGYEAYYVGGCVRNAVLGLKIKDYDITTSAKPEEVISLFADCKVFETGLKHATVTILTDMPYEVTTFRKEGKYSDSRHPDKVFFCSSLNADLERRDFTCNAMAFSKKQGIIDNFNGLYDTRNHILRAVGVPVSRFKEDPLRILRGVRFASEFGFSIEDRTARAMRTCGNLLDKVSRERVYSELKRIIEGEHFYDAVIDFADLLFIGLQTERVEKNYADAVTAVASCDGDFYTRFAVFLYIVFNGDLEKSIEIINKMRSENILKIKVKHCFLSIFILLSDLDYFKSDNALQKYTVKKIMKNCDGDTDTFISFLQAVSVVRSMPYLDRVKRLTEEIVENKECYQIGDLAINGNDVVECGFSGRRISETMNNVLDLVMRGTLRNSKNDLLEYIKGLV